MIQLIYNYEYNNIINKLNSIYTETATIFLWQWDAVNWVPSVIIMYLQRSRVKTKWHLSCPVNLVNFVCPQKVPLNLKLKSCVLVLAQRKACDGGNLAEVKGMLSLNSSRFIYQRRKFLSEVKKRHCDQVCFGQKTKILKDPMLSTVKIIKNSQVLERLFSNCAMPECSRNAYRSTRIARVASAWNLHLT